MRKLIISLIFFSLLTNLLSADTTDPIANPQLQLVGPRFLALGVTNPNLAGDSSGLLINPAILAGIESNQFSLYHQSLFGIINYLGINSAFSFQDWMLGLSFGTNVIGDIPKTLSENSRFRTYENYASGFNLIQFSIAKSFYNFFGIDKLFIGSGIKAYQQILSDKSRYGFGLDLGTICELKIYNNKVQLGASVLNAVSTPLTWSGSNQQATFSPDYLYGLKVSLFSDQLDLYVQNSIDGINLASEYKLPGNIFLRGSTDLNMINVGTGIEFENVPGLNYQNFGLRFDFNYCNYFFDNIPGNTYSFGVTILDEARSMKPQILIPAQNTLTKESFTNLQGVGVPNTNILVYLNKSLVKTIAINSKGSWSMDSLALNEGKNEIFVKGYSSESDSSCDSEKIVIYSDHTSPVLKVNVLLENNKLKLNANSSEQLAELTGVLNNENIDFKKLDNNMWQCIIPLPSYLLNKSSVPSSLSQIVISGKDLVGNLTTIKTNFFIAVNYPLDKTIINQNLINVLGESSSLVKELSINGQLVTWDKEFKFVYPLNLDSGQNLIKFSVKLSDNSICDYYLNVLNLETFSDISSISQRREIELLTTLGLIQGTTDLNFSPNDFVTNAELAKIIFNLKNYSLNSVQANSSIAVDVATTDPNAAYIKEIIDRGIMLLDDANSFNPNKTVNFSDVMVYFQRAGLINQSLNLFADNQNLMRKDIAHIIFNLPIFQDQIKELKNWKKF